MNNDKSSKKMGIHKPQYHTYTAKLEWSGKQNGGSLNLKGNSQ